MASTSINSHSASGPGPPRLPKRSRASKVVNGVVVKFGTGSRINTDKPDSPTARDPIFARDDTQNLAELVQQPKTQDTMAGAKEKEPEGKSGVKVLKLGSRVAYPIKITKLYKGVKDKIKHGESVFQYSFTWRKELTDAFTQEKRMNTVTTLTAWDAPEDGKILSWHIKEGDEIQRDQDCITVEEECTHELQFQGMCAICGKDMTEVNWASEHRDTERAPINMIHDETRLTVSKSAAAQAEAELQQRLLSSRKLSLVVDLDQTIIHACIDPTVGEWQQDPNNPNHESVKDVKKFQLNDDGPRGLASGCWYYIKLRPGLVDFLKNISAMYELHVYTMGTRAYAEHIAGIVDPGKKLFANRVISRDENGNMIAKSLQRLFPVSTNMVVIIDDRADVWPYNRPNLIKVIPYDFFKGIGDINSSFLPKRQDIMPSTTPTAPVNGSADPPAKNGQVNGTGKVSALESLASMGGGENPALLKKQTEEQERKLEQQLKERPLQHMQEKLDKEDEEATQKTEPNGEEPSPPPAQRHHVLLDDDEELLHVEKHLTDLHSRFYKEYDSQCKTKPDAPVPDVGQVMDDIKAKVFDGLTIVLSGLVPLGIEVARSEIGLQADSFGAKLRSKISKSVTHLVISSDRPRTQKVRQAVMIPSIKIVNQNWLADCLSQWKRLDEAPYLIEIHPADRAKMKSALGTPGETTDADTASVASDEDAPDAKKSKASNLKIVLTKPLGEDFDADEDDDEDGLDNSGEMSPIEEELQGFDWGGVLSGADEELAEFMASDDDDDDDEDGEDSEGDASDVDETAVPASGTKRKFDDDAINEDDTTELTSKKTKLDNGADQESSHLSAANARLLGSMRTQVREGLKKGEGNKRTSRGPDGDGKPDFDNIPDDDEDDDGMNEDDLLAELEAEEESERQQGL